MRRGTRGMAAVSVLVAAALSFATAGSSSAAPAPAGDDVNDVVEVSDDPLPGLRWLFCVNGHTNVIFRRLGNGCTDGNDTVGFAALTKQPGGYRLQVCATGTDQVAMRVDPADANGGSTGDIIYYLDDPYGPCYNRNIGYPVRKFQAVHLWMEHVMFSSWMPPPT